MMYMKLCFGDPYLLILERSPLVQSTLRGFLSVSIAAGEEGVLCLSWSRNQGTETANKRQEHFVAVLGRELVIL